MKLKNELEPTTRSSESLVQRANRLGIPSKIQILNHQIKVKIHTEPLEEDDEKIYGKWNTPELTIHIFAGNVPDSLLLHTYYHELIHAIANLNGQSKLDSNEDQIDQIAGCLAQAVSTAEPHV